jgi:hypothetical protein
MAKTVTLAEVRINHQLRVVFNDASKLVVSLRPEDRRDPEVVRCDEDDEHWAVW